MSTILPLSDRSCKTAHAHWPIPCDDNVIRLSHPLLRNG